MGGSLKVVSETGVGSTFTVSLPLVLDHSAPLSPVTDEELLPALAGVRVLIIDDHPVNRRVVHEQLHARGVADSDCASGEEALELLRAANAQGKPFHLAVVDYQMPNMDGVELARAIKGDPDIAGTALVLLTSVTHRLSAEHLWAAGFTGYLIKPVNQSDLLKVLATVWRAFQAGEPSRIITRAMIRETSLQPASGHGAAHVPRILVVEDNAINQKVAMRMLMNLGCRVDVAATGKEGIERMISVPYDLVFMDLQMPEMDGYKATAAVRRFADEEKAGTPIIAMTAHAMIGDRERCLAAGMDGYVSKPIRRPELVRVLHRFLATPKNPMAGTDSEPLSIS
jgi:CheY-like chemotaxis protein